MVVPANRNEQLARFYAVNAGRLRRTVSGKTIGLNRAVIDEACAIAWERLVRRPDIDLTCHQAFWWLYKVAVREAWRLGRGHPHEEPVGGLNGADELNEPLSDDPDVHDLVADRVELATLRGVLGELHWRERRELLLYAYGFSYEEIMAITRTSYTAVNRWLVRGKKALREARARHAESPDDDPPVRR
jgi:DNA-directed RNA polymerase specialized sigma24 family protein